MGDSGWIGEQLRARLSEQDEAHLERELRQAGGPEWLRWCDANAGKAIAFLRAKEERRDSWKWADDAQRRQTILLACLLADLASGTQEVVGGRHTADAVRERFALAASEAWTVWCDPFLHWPFGGNPPPGWTGECD